MLKNITLSADEHLIELARAKAQMKNETLNTAFRTWLLRYAKNELNTPNYEKIMNQFNYVNPGKSFTRVELNKR